MESLLVGIVGDFDAARPTHAATTTAISHAASALGVDAEASWLSTLSLLQMPLDVLGSFAGFFVAPGAFNVLGTRNTSPMPGNS